MRRDITAEIVLEAASAAIHAQEPQGYSVLFASRDPELIAAEAPGVARAVEPGRIFGVVLHHEPVEPPAWAAGRRWPNDDPLEWSEVVVADHGPLRKGAHR